MIISAFHIGFTLRLHIRPVHTLYRPLHDVFIGYINEDSAADCLQAVSAVFTVPIIGAVLSLFRCPELTRTKAGGSGTGITFGIYGPLIVLITCFQPKGVIGITGRIAEKFGRKTNGR